VYVCVCVCNCRRGDARKRSNVGNVIIAKCASARARDVGSNLAAFVGRVTRRGESKRDYPFLAKRLRKGAGKRKWRGRKRLSIVRAGVRLDGRE